MAHFEGWPLPTKQRTDLHICLNQSGPSFKDKKRLENQPDLNFLCLSVDATNSAGHLKEQDYKALVNILSAPNELKSLRDVVMQGCEDHPPMCSELPRSIVESFKFRKLNTLTLHHVTVPTKSFRKFLHVSHVCTLKLLHVAWDLDFFIGPILSNSRLSNLELWKVPHQLISKLLRGIPDSHQIHLTVSPDEDNKVFSSELWTALKSAPLYNESDVCLPSVEALTISGSPVFKHDSLWNDLKQSQLVHIGIEDAMFGNAAFYAFCSLIGSALGTIRSLRMRYWNLVLLKTDENPFEMFLRSIECGPVKEYVHEGLTCPLVHLAASRLPYLGLSAVHFEIIRKNTVERNLQDTFHRIFVGIKELERNPAPELVEAARLCKTLGVFPDPERRAEAQLCGIMGLTANGVNCAEYDRTNLSPDIFWRVFDDDQVDLLRQFEARNKRQYQRDRSLTQKTYNKDDRFYHVEIAEDELPTTQEVSWSTDEEEDGEQERIVDQHAETS